jgi:poly-beta-1,6-N-acetyl-D-glucosamine synthase
LEHRLTGSATARPLASRIVEGRRMRSLGYDPLFFMVRCIYRFWNRPRVLGSLAAILGYLSSATRGHPIVLPPEIVRHLRLEQRQKLRNLLCMPASSRITVRYSPSGS